LANRWYRIGTTEYDSSREQGEYVVKRDSESRGR
jgi:hypothetical protein